MGKADAPPAGKTEEEELEELQGMIGGVPRGMFVKLQIAQQNRNAADDVRREKAELMALRARRAQEQDERIERLRLKRESSQTAAAEAHRLRIEELGRAAREERAMHEQNRKLERQEFWNQARVRVEVANGLDDKLDAAEAAQDAVERAEAAAARTAQLAALAVREQVDGAHREELNQKVRLIHSRSKKGKEEFFAEKQGKGSATKEAKASWASQANAKKEAHLARAKANRKKREAEKAKWKAKNDIRDQERRAAAREEKANDSVATAALANEVHRNQMARMKSYARRYVPTEQVETMEASDTFRRLYGLPDADGNIKAIGR